MQLSLRGVGEFLQKNLVKAQLGALHGQADDIAPGQLLGRVQPVIGVAVIPDVAVALADGGLLHVGEGVVAVVEGVEAGHGHRPLLGAQGRDRLRRRRVRGHRLLQGRAGGVAHQARIVPHLPQEAVGRERGQLGRQRGGVRRQRRQLHQMALAVHVRRGLRFRRRIRRRLHRLLGGVHHHVHCRLLLVLLLRRRGRRTGRDRQVNPPHQGQLQVHPAVVCVGNISLYHQKSTGSHQNDGQQDNQQAHTRRMPAPVALVSLCHRRSSFLRLYCIWICFFSLPYHICPGTCNSILEILRQFPTIFPVCPRSPPPGMRSVPGGRFLEPV